jgi:hypothetical protein
MLITIIIAFSLGFSACAKPEVKPDPTVYTVGNTSGNLNNGGTFVEANGWVYYSNYSLKDIIPNPENPEYGTFRMKADGSDRVRLDSAINKGLNIVSDRIYAFDPLLSAKLDGSDIVKVRDTQPFYTDGILVVNDRIIFSDTGKENKLFTIKTDGTELKQLTTLSSKRIDFAKGWVYYSTLSPVSLRKIKLDATEDTLVSDDVGSDFIIVNDSIYYASLKDGSKLYRMDVTGLNPVKLSNLSIGSLNSDNTKLYFIDLADNKIHFANLDGTSEKSLSLNNAVNISIVTGYIYFTDNSEGQNKFRIRMADTFEENTYTVKVADPDPIGTPVIQGIGISNMNLNSGGQFARKDDWVYYAKSDFTTTRGLYRIHPDGTGETKLANVSARNLNIVKEWLYFSNQDASNRIYRIPLVGGEIERVVDIPTFSFIVKDDWIYFAVDDMNLGIRKVKIDGTGLISLTDNHVSGGTLQIADETLYYKESSDGPDVGIFGIGINRSGIKAIGKAVASSMSVDGEWIYYAKRKDAYIEWPYSIHRMKMDGSSDTLLFSVEGFLTVFGVNEGWLYFSNRKSDKGSLMRMKLDGSQRETIIAESPNNIIYGAYILNDKLISVQRHGLDFSQISYFISNLDGSGMIPFAK